MGKWFGAFSVLFALNSFAGATQPMVMESPRQIPVVADVDVVVAGGSTAGVAAAVEAAKNGAKVYLVAPKSYLGDDICATHRFWLEPGEVPQAPLAKQLFKSASPADPPTPMHFKRTLDEALLSAKVQFLFSSLITDVLRDSQGQPCGIVMANRSGRQAILAKIIIDATDRGLVARLAGAQFAPFPAGEQTFQRVVIGGQPHTAPNASVRTLPFVRKASDGKKTGKVYLYTLKLPMPDGSWSSLAAAEQLARDHTFDKEQLDASEILFQVPPQPMKARASSDAAWPGADKISLDVFRPVGVERLYVLGGAADVSRQAAEALLRPLATIDVGTRVGNAAAAQAKALPAISGARLPGASVKPAAEGDVKELLVGVRATQTQLPTVPAEARGLPVLGTFDVVVVGGGTGGAASGIGAGRQGARTLVLEALHELGGQGTLGVISGYYSGNREGFTTEVSQGIQAMGMGQGTKWYPIGKAQWWRAANRQAGVDIWYGSLGVGAFVANHQVRGVVVATPLGRGVVLAKSVVDTTGSSDIAIAAGADYQFADASEPAFQGAGLHTMNLGMRGPNTDFTFTDDTDMIDAWQVTINARANGGDAYDMGQLLQTRERRRIVGEVTLSPMDLALDRSWPDAIALAKSHFDSHGFTVHPMFWARQPDIEVGKSEMLIPLRALQPKGLQGIYVASLGVSAHRDVMPIIRMQANLENLGYAAGAAAALSAKGQLDVPALQQQLVKKGCLPETILGAKDSFPLPEATVQAAVLNVVKGSAMGLVPTKDFLGRPQVVDSKYNTHDIAVIFASAPTAIPMLAKAYAAASSPTDKLLYAHLLGILGSPAGVETLLAHVKNTAKFDEGWNFVGMRQYGRNMSEFDQFIISLGCTRDPRAVDAVLGKLVLLEPGMEFSHFRACALALETLRDPRAAEPLARLLAKPKVTGFAAPTLEAMNRIVKHRSESLREIMIARALFRCGDYQGQGRKILETYVQDLRGPYSRHARAVLDEAPIKH